MKNAAFLLSCACLFLTAWHNASAQVSVPSAPPALPSPETLVPPFSGNYLAPLLALRAAHDVYAASPQWRDQYFEDLAFQESLVGNDAQATADIDATLSTERPSALKMAADATAIKGYNPVDARETILRLATQRQAVFINQTSAAPRDSAFTLTLLRGLYERGYRYFAAGMLDPFDIGQQARGYPTSLSGVYTAEPVFGDLVRTALKLGFTVVPYNYPPRTFPGLIAFGDDSIMMANRRRQAAAQSLADSTLKRYPHAKVVALEEVGNAPTAGVIPTSAYFRRITHNDPLTIDQTTMMPHSAKAYENPVYQAVDNAGVMQETTVVLQNAKGNLYVSPENKGVYDMTVFTPRDTIEFGRPDWLSLDGLRLPYQLPGNIIAPAGTSLLVQAFYANEPPATAIPVDQIEVNVDTQGLPALMLPRGQFHLQIVDASGVVQRRWQVTIPLPDTPLP